MSTARRADRDVIVGQHREWYGLAAEDPAGDGRLAALTGAGGVALRYAGLRSVWFLNSVRGAVALAAAITVADLTGVQHGFWVVLGTLSVLRTSATSTGSTALRALAGTVAGFVIGAVLILVIGTSSAALWVALPIAVIVASYAPGVAPFAVGQAAFTVVVSVLYNLLVPAGWKIGVLRVEDVAIGCAVSLVVGLLFWPRGASAVVGDDLSDAFRQGGDYLSHSAHWALGLRHDAPEPSRTVTAGIRLDEALRVFLAEQGAKRIPKEDLWRLVGGATRLRLTAHSLAGLPSPVVDPDPARQELGDQAVLLATWFEQVAVQVGRPGREAVSLPDPPDFHSAGLGLGLGTGAGGTVAPNLSCALWVEQHLRHLTPHLCELVGPVGEVSSQRHKPWWR
jgi:Fusaric acid resistance protein-like